MSGKNAQLTVEITAHAPLLVGGARAAGRAPETLKYIPGRSLRGALADAMLAQRWHEPRLCGQDCDFCALFLAGQDTAIFRNAYPAPAGRGSRPFPLTARRCKIDQSHPLVDVLLPSMVHWLRGTFVAQVCSSCSEKLELAVGFCHAGGDGLVGIESPELRETVKVGIDRWRRCAAEEILYSLVSITDRAGDGKSPLTFCGSVICPPQLAEELASLLSRAVTRIGGATSRGYGAVSVKAAIAKEISGDVARKVREFNNALADLLGTHRMPRLVRPQGPLEEIAERENLPDELREGKGGFFAIDLISDAILPDVVALDGTLAVSDRQDFVLKDDLLRWYSNGKLNCRLVASFARHTTSSGWNATWSLPRQVDVVSQAGGVFVYWSDDLPGCLASLESIEQRGIGERTSEGFGQLEVCSALHINRSSGGQ